MQLGFDVTVGSNMLAGLSVSRSSGSFDYGVGSGKEEVSGKYELWLTGVHPYLAWSVSPNLEVWGTVGHAWGELHIADDLGGDLRARTATLGSGAMGFSGRLPTRGTATVKLKGEAAFAQLGVTDAGVAFGAATVDMQRLRLAADAGYEHVFSSGKSLAPWGELGLRHDGGDGRTGAGLEVGGGLRFRDPEKGWIMEGYGRRLLERGRRMLPREWGFGGVFRIDSDPSGRGPSASLTQSWGQTGRGVRRLWEQALADPTTHHPPANHLELRLGYGFAAFRGRGVLAPFGAVSLDRESGPGYRTGGRLAVGPSATLSLEAERREPPGAAAVHAVMVHGALRF